MQERGYFFTGDGEIRIVHIVYENTHCLFDEGFELPPERLYTLNMYSLNQIEKALSAKNGAKA